MQVILLFFIILLCLYFIDIVQLLYEVPEVKRKGNVALICLTWPMVKA